MPPELATPCRPAAIASWTSSVAEVATRLAGGAMVLVADGRGDAGGALVVAADHADAAAINVLVREARGLVCLALTPKRCARLGLRRMRSRDEIRPGRDLLVTIEASEGTSTGISTADRARTIAAAVARDAVPGDLVSPGHVVPLRTAAGGVLEVGGSAEAAIDLLRIAGAELSAVHCAVLDDDGSSATGERLLGVARRLGVEVVTVDEILGHLEAHPGDRAA